MHDLMSCKIQGKYMQFPSLVQGLSRVKEKILRWWPLIRALLDLSEKEGQGSKRIKGSLETCRRSLEAKENHALGSSSLLFILDNIK